MLLRQALPLGGQLGHPGGVHEPVAELVRELPAGPVGGPARLVEQRARARGHHHQVLHVAPGQGRVGLEMEMRVESV